MTAVVLWLVAGFGLAFLLWLASTLDDRRHRAGEHAIRAASADDGRPLDTADLADTLTNARGARSRPLPPVRRDVLDEHRSAWAETDRRLAVRRAVRRAASQADLIAFEANMQQLWAEAEQAVDNVLLFDEILRRARAAERAR